MKTTTTQTHIDTTEDTIIPQLDTTQEELMDDLIDGVLQNWLNPKNLFAHVHEDIAYSLEEAGLDLSDQRVIGRCEEAYVELCDALNG